MQTNFKIESMRSMKWLFLLSFLCGLLASCEQVAGWLDGETEVPFSIERYDRLQNELGVTGSFSTIQRMNTQFPRQTQILIEDVLELGPVTDADIMQKLGDCLSDTAMLYLMADGEAKFGDMKALNRQFEKAIKRMKDELPSLVSPVIYAQFSGLNESVVVSDSLVGFSMDKYMGTDYPLYKKYFYDNQIATMSSERIVSDCLFFYLKNNYPLPESAHGTLMDNMIHTGKINWITLHLTEKNTIEQLLGYTDADVKWIKSNQLFIENYILTHQKSTDPQVLRSLLSAVAEPLIGADNSPALLGAWFGYQMVNQFMKKNKKLSVQDLAEMDNLAEIASAFNYKLD